MTTGCGEGRGNAARIRCGLRDESLEAAEAGAVRVGPAGGAAARRGARHRVDAGVPALVQGTQAGHLGRPARGGSRNRAPGRRDSPGTRRARDGQRPGTPHRSRTCHHHQNPASPHLSSRAKSRNGTPGHSGPQRPGATQANDVPCAAGPLQAGRGFPAPAVIAGCGVPVSAGLQTSRREPADPRGCYLGWVTNPWR